MNIEQQEITISAINPFSQFHENPWEWIADNADKHTYHILDSIYRFLNQEIESDDLPEDIRQMTNEEMLSYYQEHFPPMFACCLIAIGQSIKEGKVKINLDFTGFSSTRNEDPDIWYCEDCGSTDVEIKTWTLPNQNNALGGNDSIDSNDCWCNQCEEHTRLEITTQSKYADILKQIQEQGNQEDDNTELEDTLSPKHRIQRMLLNYGVTKLDLDEYCPTGYGYIATVYTDMVEYSHGGTDDYDNLEDHYIDDLVIAVEMQIVANEKAMKRCQD